jgi:hypothetical protein
MPTRRSVVLSIVFIAVIGCRAQRLPSAEVSAAPFERGRIIATNDRIEAIFPRVAAHDFGAGFVDSIRYPAPRVTRRYCWIVSRSFPDSRYPQNHFMALGVDIRLDADAEPTSTRLDSAFRLATVDVTEAAGEPPMGIRSVAPLRAYVKLQDNRVHIVVEGRDATREFLAPSGNKATLLWCERLRYPAALELTFPRP